MAPTVPAKKKRDFDPRKFLATIGEGPKQQIGEWQQCSELAHKAGLRVGLWDWNVVANTVAWSDEAYRQFGFTRDTFSGQLEDAFARIHPEDRARLEDAIYKVLAGGTEYAAQYRVIWPDKTICWIEAHSVLLSDGPTIHMLGIGIDITNLKKSEQSSQESEEKYLLLLNSTAAGIYGLDLGGNCRFCNPACLRLLGYQAPEDLLGRNMHALIHHTRAGRALAGGGIAGYCTPAAARLLGYQAPEDLLGRNMHALIHHTRADGTPYPEKECQIHVGVCERRAIHLSDEVLWRADGTYFQAEYLSYPMHKAGTFVGSVVTFIDISQRKRAEQAVRESEEKYRKLFENATCGIFRSNQEGEFLE